MKPPRKYRQESQSAGLLQIMTISLFILLLAFFILLNSIAIKDKRKTAAAFKSLTTGFGLANRGNSMIRTTDEELLLGFTPQYNGPIDFSDLSIDTDTPTKQIRIVATTRGSAINIPASRLFTPLGTEIIPKGYPLLDKLIALIHKNNYPVDIIGHTDDVPIYEQAGMSNRELSAMRALSILKYFIQKGHIAVNRLNAFGWGPYRPMVSNSTIESRELNRRMEIVFEHKKLREPQLSPFIWKDWSFKPLTP